MLKPADSSNGTQDEVEYQDPFLRSWSKTRVHGQLRYILINGISTFGLLSAMVFMILMAIFRNLQHDLPMHHGHGFSSFSLAEALLMIVVFALVAGSIWGALMWYLNEKAFQSKTSQK